MVGESSGRGSRVEGGGRGRSRETRVEGRGLEEDLESRDQGRGLAEGVELRVEGVLGAGRWSLDARHHLTLRSQGLGEADCAAEGF